MWGFGDPRVSCLFPAVVGDRTVRHAIFPGPIEVDFAVVSSLETRWAALLLGVIGRFPAILRLLPPGLAQHLESWFAILAREHLRFW